MNLQLKLHELPALAINVFLQEYFIVIYFFNDKLAMLFCTSQQKFVSYHF